MNKKLLYIGALTLAIGACSSNKAPVQSSTNNTAATNTASTAVTDSSAVDTSSNQNISSNSVYFDTNRYDIDAKYDTVVGYNSNYLANNPTTHVNVAGNTDDVGSVEYNLSLGQRRADALKKALIAKGAGASQIEATSNGKLAAKFSNDSDEGKAQNRRADVIYNETAPAGYYLNSNGLPAIK